MAFVTIGRGWHRPFNQRSRATSGGDLQLKDHWRANDARENKDKHPVSRIQHLASSSQQPARRVKKPVKSLCHDCRVG